MSQSELNLKSYRNNNYQSLLVVNSQPQSSISQNLSKYFTQPSSDQINYTPYIISIAAVVVIVILAIVACVCVCKKRRRQADNNGLNNYANLNLQGTSLNLGQNPVLIQQPTINRARSNQTGRRNNNPPRNYRKLSHDNQINHRKVSNQVINPYLNKQNLNHPHQGRIHRNQKKIRHNQQNRGEHNTYQNIPQNLNSQQQSYQNNVSSHQNNHVRSPNVQYFPNQPHQHYQNLSPANQNHNQYQYKKPQNIIKNQQNSLPEYLNPRNSLGDVNPYGAS